MKQCLEADLVDIANMLGPAAQAFSGKSVVMTGARGFLGRHFTQVFAYLNENVLEKPCKFVGFDNFVASRVTDENSSGHSHVRFEKRDVIEPIEWTGPLDYVIHAAGIASPFYYRAMPLETLDVAIKGTRNALELATKHGARFTFFSSSEIYGDPDPSHVPTPESYRGNVSCRGPRACYDESKRVGEALAYIFHDKFGTHTTTIRPFNVYGPGMQERDYRILPNFASRIKAGKPLSIYGRGSQTRTYCYISDALVGFLLAIIRGVAGEAYNIGNPMPEISVLSLVKTIEQVLGRSIAYQVIEYPDSYPADEPMRRCPDIRKARLQLQFEPKIELQEGLRRYLAWTDQAYTGDSG
jgi:UDP-glucuronate decarboxylase